MDFVREAHKADLNTFNICIFKNSVPVMFTRRTAFRQRNIHHQQRYQDQQYGNQFFHENLSFSSMVSSFYPPPKNVKSFHDVFDNLIYL